MRANKYKTGKLKEYFCRFHGLHKYFYVVQYGFGTGKIMLKLCAVCKEEKPVLLELRKDIPHLHAVWYYLYVGNYKYSVMNCGELMKNSLPHTGVFAGWEAVEFLPDGNLDHDNSLRADTYVGLVCKILDSKNISSTAITRFV